METPIEAGSLDLWVMPAVHIYAPPATHRFVLAKTCPDCGKRTRMLGWSYEWHGASLTCLRCGREWQGGKWMPLPFMRGARAHNIAEAKARWRRDSWHNAIVSGAAGVGLNELSGVLLNEEETMAYSDYGGYAYRNGKRVEARSDATISPEGDVFGSPGMWPGFAAYAAGGKDEYEKRRDWPSGHAVLGDGPIYVVLYKQSYLSIHRGPERLDELALLKDMPAEAVESWEWDGKSGRSLNTDHFKSSGDRCVFEVDGWRLEVFFRIEDNHYQYAKLTQPDGNVWHGWSGYGVGAGLEDCGYGYSTEDREDVLRELWPESIAG